MNIIAQKTIHALTIPMFESCTQCNFEEPPSEEEELLIESNDERASTLLGSSSASQSSSFNQYDNSSIDDVPNHSQFNCKIGVRSYLKRVGHNYQQFHSNRVVSQQKVP